MPFPPVVAEEPAGPGGQIDREGDGHHADDPHALVEQGVAPRMRRAHGLPQADLPEKDQQYEDRDEPDRAPFHAAPAAEHYSCGQPPPWHRTQREPGPASPAGARWIESVLQRA